MVQKFIKFIEKSAHKELFLRILQDIFDNNLNSYDIKPITGQPGYYRLRKGSVRFVFKTTDHGNRIIEVNNRGDIY